MLAGAFAGIAVRLSFVVLYRISCSHAAGTYRHVSRGSTKGADLYFLFNHTYLLGDDRLECKSLILRRAQYIRALQTHLLRLRESKGHNLYGVE